MDLCKTKILSVFIIRLFAGIIILPVNYSEIIPKNQFSNYQIKNEISSVYKFLSLPLQPPIIEGPEKIRVAENAEFHIYMPDSMNGTYCFEVIWSDISDPEIIGPVDNPITGIYVSHTWENTGSYNFRCRATIIIETGEVLKSPWAQFIVTIPFFKKVFFLEYLLVIQKGLIFLSFNGTE